LIHEKKTPNAAHHAPAGPIAFDDILRVAGRVHALVRPPKRSGANVLSRHDASFRQF
jgi:hypothetical protein